MKTGTEYLLKILNLLQMAFNKVDSTL